MADIVTRLRVIYCAADDLTSCGTCLPCQAAAGQDIHDHDKARGRACPLCEPRTDLEWHALIAAETRLIALAEGAPTPKGTRP